MANEIGKNCTIFHQVTIGYKKGKCPTLGDNVRIYTGAVIIGGIKLGNNCTVGANSVVNKDVPENCTVAGVPARIINRKES
jgi:serine O-acetyltransferase